MKRVCKQCGRSFELSDSEIAFYKSRNLNLPKRCKECRQANKKESVQKKKEESKEENRDRDVQKQEQNPVGLGDPKVGKWVYVLIAAVILVLSGLTRIPNQFFSSADDGPSVSVENRIVNVEEVSRKAVDGTEERPPLQDADEVLQDDIDGEAVLILHEADSEKQYTFRNSQLLSEHFEKHGKDMGFLSAEEYQEAASAVVNNVNALHKTEKEDGDDVYYLEATNEFVIVSTDGHIRTYFYPDAGIDYYNRQ